MSKDIVNFTIYVRPKYRVEVEKGRRTENYSRNWRIPELKESTFCPTILIWVESTKITTVLYPLRFTSHVMDCVLFIDSFQQS